MKSRSALGILARLLAVLLAFSMVAAACGDDSDDGGTDTEGDSDADDDAADDDSPGEAIDETGNEVVGEGEVVTEEDPVRGGTLRIGVEAETDGLNPKTNNFAVSAYTIGFPIFDPLFYFDENGDWFPWLAESAEPVGDGSSWQVTLKPGITFHDDTPLNADALIANFEATINDPIISIAVVPNYPETNRYEKIDDLTLQYNLIRPTAHFPVNLTNQLGMIASPTWLAAAAEDESLDQFPVGAGPFKIESRDQDNVTRLVRNEDYWQGTEDIYLDAIEIYINTDTALAAEQVGSDALDLIITSNADATLTLRDSDGVSTIENLLSGEDFVMMNTSKPPFDDLRVRQALTFATDREGYVEFIGQGTKPAADSMYHPDLPENNPDVVQEANVPDRAGPLVDEYCGEVPDQCTDGRVNMELQFSGPSTLQDRIMALLSDGWEPFFNVTLDQLPQDDHITEVATGAWQVVTWRQLGEADPDNEIVWNQCASATGLIALNWTRYCDEERDALFFEARATDDEARRIEIMKEVQVNMNQAYTHVFLTHANWTIGFRDNVKNLCGQKGPQGETLLCNNQGRGFYHNVWLSEG